MVSAYLVAIHSFIQIYLLKSLLCVRLCARHGEVSDDQDRPGSCSLGACSPSNMEAGKSDLAEKLVKAMN